MTTGCDVLMICPTLGVGGAERLRATVAPALTARGLRVRVAAIRRGGPFESVLAGRGVAVDVLNLPGTLTSWRTQASLRRYVSKHRPRVVQSGQFLTNLHAATAARAAGAELVVIEEHGFNDWKRWRHRLLDRTVTARAAAAVVCCSEAVAVVARQSYPGCDVVAIPNCVDPEALQPTGAASIPAAVGPVVITIGTLRREKGHDRLLEAWDQLAASGRRPDGAALWIVGDGPERGRLAQRTAGDRSVRLLGNRADVADLLHAADVFAFPSLSEGFGIALAEAMWVGVAAVGSRSGGIVEVLDDGRAGLLVDPESVDALADAIGDLLADLPLRHRTRDAGRDHARANFDPARYVDRLLTLYRRHGVDLTR